MPKYDRFTSLKNPGRKVIVEAADRDGEGKNIANNYAKQNGSYSTMTVGLAEGIATDRVIEDADVSCPPITFGTAGGEAEIQTGNNKFKLLLGNSRKWNQLAKELNSTNWSGNGATASFSDGVATFTATGIYGGLSSNTIATIKDHKYLFIIDIKPTSNMSSGEFSFVGNNAQTEIGIKNTSLTGGVWNRVAAVVTQDTIGTRGYDILYFYDNRAGGWDEIQIKSAMLVDLTEIYGAGNEPTTIEQFKADYPLDYYAYDAGSILSSKSASLISRGRNQWDEEWENGAYNVSDGTKINSNDCIRSKNAIKCLPNTEYYIVSPSNLRVLFYNASGEYLSYADWRKDTTFTTPANAYSFKFYSVDGVTAYNNDICIYINWDTPGLPYVAYSQQIIELPNIELRSVPDYSVNGVIRDEAYQQGGGKRKTKSSQFSQAQIDSMSLNDYYTSLLGVNCYSINKFSDAKDSGVYKTYIIADKIECSIFKGSSYNSPYIFGEAAQYQYMAVLPNLSLEDAKSFLASINFIYALAEPTDIPLSENPGWTELVHTDNYGTLEFTTDPAQVPQVPQAYYIEYVISLTDWLDSAYTHTNGDPEAIATDEDLQELDGRKADIEDLLNGTVVPKLAENLTPYSDGSGVSQDVPFIEQGTGCGNGTNIVDTGSIGQLKEKRGNSVVVNQQLNLDSFETQTINGVTFTNNNDGSITVDGTSEARVELYVNSKDVVEGHKYLLHSTIGLLIHSGSWFISNEDSKEYTISEATGSGREALSFDILNTGVAFNNVKFVPFIIDLTQWFGSNDNIPADLLAHPENFFRYYQGSLAYTATPQIVDSNAQIIKCTGRNIWDEEWEVGYIDDNGNNYSANEMIRSIGYTKVSPNTSYYFYCGGVAESAFKICYYDKDKNFIEVRWVQNGAVTIPSNCAYIRFTSNTSYGATYNHDITISHYYEDESGYDQYYPYELLSNVDTGSETLKQGRYKTDVKTPDGKIIHKVATYVFTGEENWQSIQGLNEYFLICYLPSYVGDKVPVDVGGSGGEFAKCNLYESNYPAVYLGLYPSQGSSGARYFAVYDPAYNASDSAAAWKQHVKDLYDAGTPLVINYDLADTAEYEEQGTPFQENLDIDDFGDMYVETPEGVTFNGVPFGNRIFYPVDYKAYTDTLYNRTRGDGNNVVTLENEGESLSDGDPTSMAAVLAEIRALHQIEQTNLGGTLRQLLVTNVTAGGGSLDFSNTDYIDFGNESWIHNGGGLFYITISAMQAFSTKALCTKYAYSSETWGEIPNKMFGLASGGGTNYIMVKDTDYNDATAFKNAVKGVLLAYEKASE